MIRKLKIKFIATNMILVTIVLLITFIAVYASTSKDAAQETTMFMKSVLENRDDKMPPKREIGRPADNNRLPPNFIPVFSVQLDANQQLMKVTENNLTIVDEAALNRIIAESLSSQSQSGILPEDNLRYMILKNDFGTKIVFADRTYEINRLSSLIKTSALVGSGSLIAFFFISLFLARWAVKPIAKSWEQQKQFVADASHELKTPLTVILANTDILMNNRDKTVAEQQKWIDYIQMEAKRMTSLVNNLLFLAKTDDHKDNAVFSEVNFSDIVWSGMLPFESVAFEQGKTLESQIENDIIIRGDEGKLKQLVVILLDNAIKYADPQGSIFVSLSREQDKIKLSVRNSGEPIPADQLEHIFKRFYCVDKSRAREKGGYGLGLAIADSIVSQHHGRISVTSSQQDGTTFSVVFSKKKTQAK